MIACLYSSGDNPVATEKLKRKDSISRLVGERREIASRFE